MSEEYFELTGQLGGSMTNTTKHETVLIRQGGEESPLLFTWWDDEEEGVPGPSLLLTRREWEDLGQPDTITIAMWPGDKLNEQPFTRATREVLDEESQQAHVEFSGQKVEGAYDVPHEDEVDTSPPKIKPKPIRDAPRA